MSSSTDNKTEQESVLVSLMEDAIELMQQKDKRYYLEALEKCPHIVETETDFVNYLRYEDYDIWKATNRLLKSWEWRVKLFGHRAFRSLFDLTGHGALDEIDVRAMATKAHVLLPEDENGDPVLFYDIALYGKRALDGERFARQVFFIMEFIGIQQRYRGHKVAHFGLLVHLKKLPPWLMSRNNWTKFVGEAFAARCKWMRYVYLSKDKPQKVWFQAIYPILQRQVLNAYSHLKVYQSVRFYCHETEESLMSKLISLGMKKECLPPSVGGTWSYDNYSVFERLPIILQNSKCRPILPYAHPKPLNSPINAASDSAGMIDESTTTHTNNYLMGAEINKIPYAAKISWITALQTPAVEKDESFHDKFLQFHGSNSFKAAEHLFSYWSMREKLFIGRGFSSMNQLGSGALNREDIQIMQSGFLMLLPKDAEGNLVLFYEPSRLPEPTFASQRRVLFYMLFLAVEKSLRETTTIKIVISLRKNELLTEKKRKFILHDVIKAFPLRVVGYHLILQQDALVDELYRKEAVMKVLLLFGITDVQLLVHTKTSDLDFMCDELAIYGLEPKSIPLSLGGTWGEDSFLMWQDELIKHEATYRCQEPFRDEWNWKVIQRKLDQKGKISDKDRLSLFRKGRQKRDRQV